jgi:Ohr subfamily peroxiredoxin
MMSNTEQVLYTGITQVAGGGRDGSARSDDGRLDVRLASFGSTGPGTNPEQLLGAGWGACYLGALRILAREHGVAVPQDAGVAVEVDLVLDGPSDYRLQARIRVALPGLRAEQAHALAIRAHGLCPYSKALHASTRVTTDVVV